MKDNAMAKFYRLLAFQMLILLDKIREDFENFQEMTIPSKGGELLLYELSEREPG